MLELPSNVEVRELLPHGVHYILPQRSFPRTAGIAILLGGVVAAVFSLVWLGILTYQLFDQPNREWSRLLYAFFVLPFLSGGTLAACFGYFLLNGHAEVKLEQDSLFAIERAGWLRKTWEQKIQQIDALQVVAALESSHDQYDRLGNTNNLCRIKAGTIFLAPGYPRPLCEALAEDLIRRWPLSFTNDSAPRIPRLEEPEKAVESNRGSEMVDRPTQPADSRVEVQDTVDTLTLRIPSAGLRKGSKGLFGFAILWNLFMTVFTVITVVAGGFKDAPIFILPLALGIFWAVGMGSLLGAINMGRREAAIVVAGDRLLVIQKGIFGTKRQQWVHNEIGAVSASPNGMKVNDVPVIELQIRSAHGKKFGVLGGRNDDELEWLATIVRHRLNL